MARLSITEGKTLAHTRREKGMAQSALAKTVECRQTVISMLKARESEKFAMENVQKASALLDVPVASKEKKKKEQPRAVSTEITRAFGFCPNAHCLPNVPYAGNSELFPWPSRGPSRLARASRNRCAFCGELFETGHPACATPRGTDALPPEIDAVVWAAGRRKEILEWRQLIQRDTV